MSSGKSEDSAWPGGDAKQGRDEAKATIDQASDDDEPSKDSSDSSNVEPHSPSRRGLLRRNVSMPSLGGGDDECGGLMRRACSLEPDSDDDEQNLFEVDGKTVLAPQSERLKSKSNPYVGTFHYGHQASKLLSKNAGESPSRKNSPPQDPQYSDDSLANSPFLAAQKSPANGSEDAFALNDGDELRSDSPLNSPLPRFLSRTGSPTLSRTGSPTLSRAVSSSSSTSSVRHPMTDREKMKQALQLMDTVPSDPEMCGLQALLPRQAGVQVQYKVGEGSFGKCVKVLNRKNKQEWSGSASKRGFERHLNELPMEGESLVIKYIKKDDPSEDTSLAPDLSRDILQGSVQREIRIHGKCNHPNIVRLFGHYELGDKVGLILGFVEGAELHDILHIKRKLPEAETFVIMLQIMRATAYLHSIDIIHRDLKPRNVLVSNRLRVHVIDLGLAIDMSDPSDNKRAAQAVVGTQGYMPPEMLRGEPVTAAMDMWALGVMLYEMVFGFAPFLPHEMMMPAPVEFPDESWGIIISPDLRHLISQLLAKDKKQRIDASNALNHAWCDMDKVEAADAQLGEAAKEERAEVCPGVQKEFSEEVLKTVKESKGSLDKVPSNEENDDGNIDPVHNGTFSYAYYHAVIMEGGRNDLA